MTTDIKMDFDDVRGMAAVLKQAAQDLEQLSATARRWSARMKEGALLGEAGMAMAQAFDSTLNARVQNMAERTREAERDILAALDSFQAAVQESKGQFG